MSLALTNARRHDAASALPSPMPVSADVSADVAVYRAAWCARGRPPAILTFFESTCRRVTSTVFECTWHGQGYLSSGPVGSWVLCEGGTRLVVRTRYFPTDRVVETIFMSVGHEDGYCWESVGACPSVVLMEAIPAMVRLVRSGEEGPFPSTPPTDWQIVSAVVPM